MPPSGTTNFGMTNGTVIAEAVERVMGAGAEVRLTRDQTQSAVISLNLEMQRFGSPARGPNLWKTLLGETINLVEGQTSYEIDPSILDIYEVWYTTVNGNGAGYNLDRIMVPITRTQYAMIPNKLQPGTPTQFWFQKVPAQQLVIWQPPSQGAPNYLLTYNAIQRIDDANIGGAETPDVAYRALDALCARLAYRLAPKLLPRQEWPTVLPILKTQADEAWDDFATEDQENGPMVIQPNIAGYGRL